MTRHRPLSLQTRWSMAIIVFTLLLGVVAGPRAARADVTVGATREIPDGKLDYTPAVADLAPASGQYMPQILLDVLPGAAGQAPSLALVYSSNRSNGPQGAGWGFTFELSIERKSKYGGIAQMNDDDTFWSDGQKLIETADGTYRTEQLDFNIYKKITDASGITGWTALKDGFTRHYGITKNINSTIDANAVEYQDEDSPDGTATGAKPVRWHLSKTETAFGVEVAYRYVIPNIRPNGATSHRHLPDKIIYDKTASGWNQVVFLYEERPDVRVSYANGAKRTEAQRLRSITVQRLVGTGGLARTSTSHSYLFNYSLSIHSPQSLLSEVKRQEVFSPGSSTLIPDTQLIARFTYADSATAWGERRLIPLVGDPPQRNPPQPSDEYFSFALPGDINGDSRVDLVIFNDTCFIQEEHDRQNGQQSAGVDLITPTPFTPPPDYVCTQDHRVYLNTIHQIKSLPSGISGNRARAVEAIIVGSNTLVYNDELSEQLKGFYGSLHDDKLFLETEYAAIIDVDSNGYADLLGSGKLALGGPYGWGKELDAPWISWLDPPPFSGLDEHQFADIDGDGRVDLVSQSGYFLNTGLFPFFDSQIGGTIDDPVVDLGYSEQYNEALDTDCLDASATDMILRWDYGVNNDGDLSSEPPEDPEMTAARWVWRNTDHPDVNRDGLADRVISFGFLRILSYDDLPDMWIRDDHGCGVFDQVFLGNGFGDFEAAGYGIGGPMQREEEFEQTRFVEQDINNTASDLFSFNYHVNHFSTSDVDGDGHNEITQFCDDNDTTFLAMSDQGIGEWHGYGPGFQINAEASACPEQFTAIMPEKFFGLSLFDYHLSTLGDFDGNGFSDVIMYSHPYGKSNVVISNTGTPWADWENGLYWRENLRDTVQNRLVSITGPHGGTTQVTWTFSAQDPDNHLAINVEHVESITNGDGRFVFSFSKGAFSGGEFLGFGEVETLRPRGSTLVQTFFNNRILRNKPMTEQLYTGTGRLKNLRVHVPGAENGKWQLDFLPPYYRPLQQMCEFEFDARDVQLPIGADIDAYIAKCEAFDDEEGFVIGEVLNQRSLSAVMRGGDPMTLAHSATEQRELVALRSLLLGQDPAVICPPADSNAAGQALAVCNLLSPTPGPIQGSWSAAPYRTRWKLAFPGTELPTDPDPRPFLTERMYVTQYDYDYEIGHIVEQRELRDVETREDTLIHRFRYTAWDETLGGARLIRQTTTGGRFALTFADSSYEAFENGQWQRRVETNPQTGATRSESRTFTLRGEIKTTTDFLGRVTTYAYGACGVRTRETDSIGYVTSTLLNSVCRPTQVLNKFDGATIAQTDFDYDLYGDVIERSTDPAVGADDAMPVIVEQFAYAPNSPAGAPAAVTIQLESDGSLTLEKRYVDGHGRTLKTVHCAGSATGSSGHLDMQYPCLNGSEVVTEISYNPDTGDKTQITGPYLSSAAVTERPLQTFGYDAFGRLLTERQPDGTSLTYSYGLGRRSVTDEIGRETTVAFTTLSEEVIVAGSYRGGTIRNAFGQVKTLYDADKNPTTFSYDGFNRKRDELLPAVDILASGASELTFAHPTISYRYNNGDQLLSRRDANGNVTTFEYDANGRLSLTRGPDGLVIERREYVEGGYGTRTVTVHDSRLDVARAEHLDGTGRIWKQVAFDGTETITDYDARGRAFRQTLPWGEVLTTIVQSGGLSIVATSTQANIVAATTSTLDARGLPLTVTDADGQLIRNEYDVMARLVTTWQGNRELEHRTYDSVGRPVTVRSSGALTCLTYDNLDNVTLEEQGCPEDEALRSATVEGGRGLVNVQRTYTNRNQIASEIDGAGNKTVFTYDALGRVVASETFDANDTSLGQQQFSYDAVGNLTKSVDELTHVSRKEYDAYARPIAADSADQEPSTIIYVATPGSWVITKTAPTGEQTSAAIDAMGRQWRTCGADGVCIVDQHVDGLLITRTRLPSDAANPTVAPGLQGTKYFQYYPSSSRIQRESDWIGAAEIPLLCRGAVPNSCQTPHIEHTWTTAGRPATLRDVQGNLTAYTYDVAGQSLLLTSMSRTGLPSQRYEYDATYALLITQRTVDPAHGAPDIVQTTNWEQNFRPSRIVRSNGSWLTEVVDLGYDAAGRRNYSRSSRGTEAVEIAETFDAYSNPISRAYNIVTTAGSYTGTLRFSWRNNGQIAGVTYPSNNAVTYSYAAATGRLQTVSAGATTVFEALRYDGSGRARELRLANGAIHLERTFDPAGREQTRRITGIAPAVRAETYDYDALGRLTTVSATGGAATTAVYGYDARDLLTSETHTLGGAAPRSFAYVYETDTGLRRAKTDTNGATAVTTVYSYTTGNRLAAVDRIAISWNPYGHQMGDAAGRTFHWGLSDQLVAIEEAGATLETMLHDAAGLRVARTSAAGTEVFLAGPAGEVLERRTSDGATVGYVRLPGGIVVATLDASGAITPVLNNITGSPYRIGEQSASHRYQEASAFGEVMREDGALDEPLAFHQMFSSAAAGIEIAGVRAYDVTTGRFLSADRLGFGASPDPVRAADPFRYSENNPVARQDATGYAPCLQTLEGGCRSNLGEQGTDADRYAMVANGMADDAITRQLQKNADEWHEIRNPTGRVANASDGQQVEQSNSTAGRSPNKLEKSGEPRKFTSRIGRGWAGGSGFSDSALDLTSYEDAGECASDGSGECDPLDDPLEIVVEGTSPVTLSADRLGTSLADYEESLWPAIDQNTLAPGSGVRGWRTPGNGVATRSSPLGVYISQQPLVGFMGWAGGQMASGVRGWLERQYWWPGAPVIPDSVFDAVDATTEWLTDPVVQGEFAVVGELLAVGSVASAMPPPPSLDMSRPMLWWRLTTGSPSLGPRAVVPIRRSLPAWAIDVDDIVANPRILSGRTVVEIGETFNAAGYGTTVVQSTRGSMRAVIVRVTGPSPIQQIQVHPGGGRHVGAYMKLSTNNGRVKLVDHATYVPTAGEKARIIYIDPETQ